MSKPPTSHAWFVFSHCISCLLMSDVIMISLRPPPVRVPDSQSDCKDDRSIPHMSTSALPKDDVRHFPLIIMHVRVSTCVCVRARAKCWKRWSTASCPYDWKEKRRMSQHLTARSSSLPGQMVAEVRNTRQVVLFGSGRTCCPWSFTAQYQGSGFQ